ncbi:lipoprotein [Spiroplasma endosymbiont of Nebria brevicollis]|uniref:lipoprotein n=1 Tax=Spiroplasma endosymbiont of Nebria brevicollis TaxID=3066284 RepID=UPI00313AD15D
MRKILSILGATFLSITTSAGVAACDKREKPISLATKIDISNKIPSIVNLGQLVTKNVAVFKIELQKQLRNLNELKTIQTTDFAIYKAGKYIVDLQTWDIFHNSSLDIKIIANGNHFVGTANNIRVNYS